VYAAADGNSFVVMFRLNDHYKNPQVTVGGAPYALDEPDADVYTVTIASVTQDTAVRITASLETFSVTGVAEHVTVTSPADGETTVAYGNGATITFTVDEYYRNPQVTIGGEPYALGAPNAGVYTVTIASVTQDAAVRITASPQTFTLILAADANVITLLSPQAQGEIPVDYGSSFTVSFRVAAGYEPVVSTDGTPVPAGAPDAEGVYTVTAVQQVAAQEYFVNITAKVATPSAVSKEDPNDPVVRVQYYTVMGVETPKPAVTGVYVVKRTLASKKITVRKELVIVR
jgi:hypothetical protein